MFALSVMVVNIGRSSYRRSMGSHTSTDRHPRDATADEIAVRLRAAGLSPTPRRRHVLGALEGRRRPVGAHDLYVELAGQGHRVGMSTVYRTLAALAESGLLHVFILRERRATGRAPPDATTIWCAVSVAMSKSTPLPTMAPG
jgi:hypothetical protein